VLRLVTSPSAADRIERATRWLKDRGRSEEVIIVGATLEAVADLCRSVGSALGGTFGWHRFTLAQLAWSLARAPLASRGLVPVSPLVLGAVSARVIHAASAAGALGRFSVIADRPGLPRALASSLSELRLGKVDVALLKDPDLAALAIQYENALLAAGLADRAELFAAAAAAASGHPRLGKPVLFLDAPIHTACELGLVVAIAGASPELLFTVPAGDERTLRHIEGVPGLVREEIEWRSPTALQRTQRELFAEETSVGGGAGKGVEVFSAPGESRECVEIARLIHRAAEDGVPFDRMAVLLRSPLQYRAHLEEAFRRGAIPVYFARGTARPDPAGRAFLALLACASDGLSASRFAEYLSIGEVPDATAAGSPPPAIPAADRWVPPDDEVLPAQREPPVETQTQESLLAAPPGVEEQPVLLGTLRAPRLWERLIVDAAVIGGLDRWTRRLDGLREDLLLKLGARSESDDNRAGLLRTLVALDGLREYSIPLIKELALWPRSASWREWLERLGALATRALAHPGRVLAVLAELAPMGDVGPVDLSEVRFVLERRLTDVVVPSPGRRFGRVFVASTDEARGLAFDLVFIPGLAERLFPRKIMEDPILPDRVRKGTGLATNSDRGSAERLALRIALGAARERVVVSFPRLDLEQSRPRTPSFYGLEVLRAAEGELPDFDTLARRANTTGAARVGWPAPASPELAIDDAEHDLALLDSVLRRPEAETVGAARYLMSSNVHLARALRFRAKRALKGWTEADVLVSPAPAAQHALMAHALGARSYSATGLQNYAACPYRFLLQAVHRLSPREEPQPIEELDPLQRGSLIHEVQFQLLSVLRGEKLLPVTTATLEDARRHLEIVIERVVARYREDLAPAIDRVWDDGVARIKADLREWLRRSSQDPSWEPVFFELSFGLEDQAARDPNSRAAPVPLECGIQLRGSIDLVETNRAGAVRATDHKTGKRQAEDGIVIKGGSILQPVLYALALEKLLPGRDVVEGRLYYCTSVGEYAGVAVPLDDHARHAAVALAQAVDGAVSQGFLPAAPARGACEYCDYLSVCGPGEEARTSGKKRERLVLLDALRKEP
jgi:ATP-dependent helicase/nuclease subunit B